jgi:hypothetical protein
MKGEYNELNPTIFETEIPLLKIHTKIRPSHTYRDKEDIRCQIAIELEKNMQITSWTTVKYYRIVPPIFDNFEKLGIFYIAKNDEDFPNSKFIDTTWYRREMMHITHAMMSIFRNIR